eukprot:TRINITY_DN5888_c0_g1_i8.p1 TRINITY_DN5888_c0_g1~~TRINITY_DN5888_c0_g1_i8.p1  ORF type:complete len:233 (-),score=28.67 TRINITY_DN5888_c0_g1_i8:16-675(-)
MARANPTTRTYLLCAQRIPSLLAVPGEVHSLVVRLWLDPFFAVWRPSHLTCRYGSSGDQDSILNPRSSPSPLVLRLQTRTTDRPMVTLWLQQQSNGHLAFGVEGILPPTIAYSPSLTNPCVIGEPRSPPTDIAQWPDRECFGNWRLIRRGNGLEVRNTHTGNVERVDVFLDGTLRYASTRAGVLFVRPTGTEHSRDVTGIDFAWEDEKEGEKQAALVLK